MDGQDKALSYPKTVGRYDLLEVTLKGPSEGNPFVEKTLSGAFLGAGEQVKANGFYDGDGIYRVRFMPSFTGVYTFTLTANFLVEPLTGQFTVGAARANNHGPVGVTGGYHFAYADGTPYYSVGTTCYVWALQSDQEIENTLRLLEEARFNKIRFCLLPKHYAYNLREPRSYPYLGTPMDSSVLTTENFNSYTGKTAGNHWDFSRFNPQHFQHLERCVARLGEIGVQADIIVMHPYDRWGFSSMTSTEDERYWNYVVARFSAFHNVWWSLANEYDLMPQKSIADWERYGEILVNSDPYHHLRSIHNCKGFYDYHRPWITHCSIQRQECYMSAEYVNVWRETYKKPVVVDEMSYEGNLSFGWGNITGEEMLRRCWETVCRGGYPGHGETYHSEEGPVWWSHGGALLGESYKRMGFLLDVLKSVPGHGIAPISLKWDMVSAVPECEWMRPIKSWYLVYFSFMQPIAREFYFDESTPFLVEVLDTWNRTIEAQGVKRGRFTVTLPGRPYMAVRFRAVLGETEKGGVS